MGAVVSTALLSARVQAFRTELANGADLETAYIEAIERRWTAPQPDADDAISVEEATRTVSGAAGAITGLQERFRTAAASGRHVWISSGRNPQASLFAPPSGDTWAQKPAHGGMFLVPDAYATPLWEHYARMTFPTRGPDRVAWDVHVRVDDSVVMIDTLSTWADFVVANGKHAGDVVEVDWAAAAKRFSAVVILPLVPFLADGVFIRHAGRVLAPSSWSVPTTVLTQWELTSFRRRELPAT